MNQNVKKDKFQSQCAKHCMLALQAMMQAYEQYQTTFRAIAKVLKVMRPCVDNFHV